MGSAAYMMFSVLAFVIGALITIPFLLIILALVILIALAPLLVLAALVVFLVIKSKKKNAAKLPQESTESIEDTNSTIE